MNSNIKFLQDRITIIQNRLEQNEDFKELKVLDRMISELLSTSINTQPINITNELFSTTAAAKYLGYSVTTLENWRGKKIGPKWKKEGRSIYYSKQDLDKFAKKKFRTPRNLKNSPLGQLPIGGRLEFIYDTVIEILKKHPGLTSIKEINKIMESEYDITWPTSSNASLGSYIATYHKLKTANVRLELFPKIPEGASRVRKYTHVTLLKRNLARG